MAETSKTQKQFTQHNGNLWITIAIYETTANLKTHWQKQQENKTEFFQTERELLIEAEYLLLIGQI